MKSAGIFDSREVLLNSYNEMPLSLAYMHELIISGQYGRTKMVMITILDQNSTGVVERPLVIFCLLLAT